MYIFLGQGRTLKDSCFSEQQRSAYMSFSSYKRQRFFSNLKYTPINHPIRMDIEYNQFGKPSTKKCATDKSQAWYNNGYTASFPTELQLYAKSEILSTTFLS